MYSILGCLGHDLHLGQMLTLAFRAFWDMVFIQVRCLDLLLGFCEAWLSHKSHIFGYLPVRLLGHDLHSGHKCIFSNLWGFVKYNLHSGQMLRLTIGVFKTWSSFKSHIYGYLPMRLLGLDLHSGHNCIFAYLWSFLGYSLHSGNSYTLTLTCGAFYDMIFSLASYLAPCLSYSILFCGCLPFYQSIMPEYWISLQNCVSTSQSVSPECYSVSL